jgi:PAS domain S-box-containing protein
MSVGRWWSCALLLALTAVPLSLEGLQPTSYGGWPALGFAVALFLVAGPEYRWQVALAETVVATPALMLGYDVTVWRALFGTLALTMPALLSQHLLTRHRPAHLLLDEVDSVRYHAGTAASALLCAGFAALAVVDSVSSRDLGLSVLMAFFGGLTAQLAVLPLLVPRSRRRASGGMIELTVQRLLLVAVMLVVFLPSTSISLAFLVFPVLGWAALRATRREAHIQLFAVCVAAYGFTFRGYGPLAAPNDVVPEDLTPTLLYLFMAACCYLIVPLTLNVERLSRMTSQATRSATTIQRLLDSASGTLFIATDAIGRITHYNAGAEQALGYSQEEVLGQSPGMFHTEEETARQAREMGVPNGYLEVVLAMVNSGARRDWEFVRKDGTRRITSLTLSEVTDPEGGVLGYIGAGEDITERVRAQEALTVALEREHASVQRLVEVDNVKQDLVSNVSHELRTPITSISGYAEVLVDGSLGELNQEQADAVRRIERNTGRLGLLVEDLLTLSRAESGPLDLDHGELDLREVVAEAFELLEDLIGARALDVRLELPEEQVIILGDAPALERVVMNLMSNSIKFTPDGGRVTVTVRPWEGGAELLVSDTGIGIPESDQEQLFTRFFRAAAANEQAIQGSGLGLSIVHALVVQHGGTVSVVSHPGEGTTVTVRLPFPSSD